MDDPGVRDTAAYRIVRQITDHVYGPDEKVSDSDFIKIYEEYNSQGGSWEKLMAGDMGCVKIIEDAIDALMQNRRMATIAARVAGIK